MMHNLGVRGSDVQKGKGEQDGAEQDSEMYMMFRSDSHIFYTR